MLRLSHSHLSFIAHSLFYTEGTDDVMYWDFTHVDAWAGHGKQNSEIHGENSHIQRDPYTCCAACSCPFRAFTSTVRSWYAFCMGWNSLSFHFSRVICPTASSYLSSSFR